jgi:hypothetical protein
VRAAAATDASVAPWQIVRTTTMGLDPGFASYRGCREELAPFVPDASRSHQSIEDGVVVETQRGPAFTGLRTAALVSWMWPVVERDATRYERDVIAAYSAEPAALSDTEMAQIVASLQALASEQVHDHLVAGGA